ncbi:MAG: NAD(P)/FAD-dependent oxidoreductase [Roseateles asaccharophilus]|uniref:Geranylgeranyl reductase family protein n=1 Tax=Roseateles asaccharophilus TaxID=582607 RepID=A0A4V3CKC0_9BURK|nr:geranylgeranyl reductase family protein [Roseateles asaccharophilus]MDN3542973.1 geranylgeranyl reductase family protein [Roseateles asaccharophilus]TDP13327.1 geranylgeranyl reductase family protein [Roseateles asaccharophilus]
MSESPDQLMPMPQRCELLIIGAGPAGSAAARQLARGGVEVLLVDQHAPGRDKICGDGLIPDAHQALAKLGLLEAVMARAQPVAHVGCIGPRGGRIDVPGTLAVLPRRELDRLLLEAAQEAGAQFRQARFEAPLEDASGRVIGARLRLPDGHLHEIQARCVLLATGAVPKALTAAGMCERHTPSGVALRGYVKAPQMVGRIKALEVVWDKSVRPGYGWIFPAPDGHFNIGVGVTDSHRDLAGKGQKKDVNLRAIFDAFVEHYAPAAELMRVGELVGELKGAPLRCTLTGARWSRPGLMVIGEAAGSTYSFTGEGIGKAMETGMLAAEALLAHGSDDDAAVRAQYEAGLRALKPKYELYERANRINAYPWLTDLLIWRAHKSERLLRRMSGVLNETSNPGNLVSWRGLTRIIWE